MSAWRKAAKRLRGMGCAAFFALAPPCWAADVTLAWDAPTTNTDGSALTDLTHYEIDAVRVGVSAQIISNRVLTLLVTPISTNTYLVPAAAAGGGGSQTNTLTGLTAGVYVYRARAVAGGATESADSNSCTNRCGTPSTVPLRVVK